MVVRRWRPAAVLAVAGLLTLQSVANVGGTAPAAKAFNYANLHQIQKRLIARGPPAIAHRPIAQWWPARPTTTSNSRSYSTAVTTRRTPSLMGAGRRLSPRPTTVTARPMRAV